MMAKTAVLIINWNNSFDTINAIKSVLHLNDTAIFLLDNDSKDNSVAELKDFFSTNSIIYSLINTNDVDGYIYKEENVVFVLSDSNRGFAGGNNILLKCIIQNKEFSYAWLLNNDAIADSHALNALINKMNEDSHNAFVGSVILDYFKQELIQCCGVKYYKYFGVSKLLLKNVNWQNIDKVILINHTADFQQGSSLLVRLSALEKIGLMDERFFLYFEEQDWQYSGINLGYKQVLATESIVYHKGSVSTNNKKHLFFYYYNKSAMIFAKKHSSFFVRNIAAIMLCGITLIRSKLFIKSIVFGFKGILEGYFTKL